MYRVRETYYSIVNDCSLTRLDLWQVATEATLWSYRVIKSFRHPFASL